VPKWPKTNFPFVLIRLSLIFEAFHFWPSEGSENGKLQKCSPQIQLQRGVPKWPKITCPFVLIGFALILRHFIFGHVRVAKMVNYIKIVLKGDCKEKCPSGQKLLFKVILNLRFSLILRHFIFGNLRVARMVNYKKIILKGDCKEECPSGQKALPPLF